MLEELVVKNLNRFEVVLNAQLGNIDRRGKYLELKLVYVRGWLVVLVLVSSCIVIIGPIVVIIVVIIVVVLILVLVVIILVQGGPARHGQGQADLPPHWRLQGVGGTGLQGRASLAHRSGLRWSRCFPLTERVTFCPGDFIFQVH